MTEILYVLLHTYLVISTASAIFGVVTAQSPRFKEYFEVHKLSEGEWNLMDTLITALFFFFLWPYVLYLIFKET